MAGDQTVVGQIRLCYKLLFQFVAEPELQVAAYSSEFYLWRLTGSIASTASRYTYAVRSRQV